MCYHQTSRPASKVKCFLALCESRAMVFSRAQPCSPAKQVFPGKRMPCPEPRSLRSVLFSVMWPLCFQCKEHKQSLVFAVTLGKPVHASTGFESVLRVAWGCGFLLFSIDAHGGCVSAPFTKTGRTAVSTMGLARTSRIQSSIIKHVPPCSQISISSALGLSMTEEQDGPNGHIHGADLASRCSFFS